MEQGNRVAVNHADMVGLVQKNHADMVGLVQKNHADTVGSIQKNHADMVGSVQKRRVQKSAIQPVPIRHEILHSRVYGEDHGDPECDPAEIDHPCLI